MAMASAPSSATPAPVKPGPDTLGQAAAQAAAAAASRRRRLRVRTLITLRWLALAGQAATLVVAAQALRLPGSLRGLRGRGRPSAPGSTCC